MQIYGFHPADEAVQSVGGDEAVIDLLKRLETLPGALQLDTAVFVRADELAQGGARTVWQMTTRSYDEEYDRVKSLGVVVVH